MPYNNTPISRPEAVTGTNFLPLARIQKIINADEEVEQCSKNAAFAIAIATEEFIWHIVEKSQEVARASGRGNRKASSLTYADIANAVSRIDNLEFLGDVVPRTMKYKDFVALKEKKKAEAAARGVNGLSHGLNGGQSTLGAQAKDASEMEGVEGVEAAHTNQHPHSVYGNGVLPVVSPTAHETPRPSTATTRASFDAVRNEFVAPDAS